MELKVGQRVFVKEKEGLKNIYGNVVSIIRCDSRQSPGERVLLQLTKFEEIEEGKFPHNATTFKNKRYWFCALDDITKANHTPFDVGCRARILNRDATVIKVKDNDRVLLFDNGSTGIYSVDNLRLIDEPINVAMDKAALALTKIAKNEKKNIDKNMQGLTIKVVDNKVIAIDKDGNKGIAKCCPEDEFNIETGVNIAVTRLMQNKQANFKPYMIDCAGNFKGYIGEETNLKDDFDTPLKIGDIVKTKYKSYSSTFTEFVFKDKDGKVYFSGWCGTSREELVVFKLPDQSSVRLEKGRKILTKEDEEKYVKRK